MEERMVDVEYKLSDDMESYLDDLSSQYVEAADHKKSYEKICKSIGDMIKDFCIENKISKYKTPNGFNIAVSITPNITVDEELLVAYLKENGFESAVKTVESVDFDVLESLIKTGQLDSDVLTKFRTVGASTVRLNCQKSKKKQLLNE